MQARLAGVGRDDAQVGRAGRQAAGRQQRGRGRRHQRGLPRVGEGRGRAGPARAAHARLGAAGLDERDRHVRARPREACAGAAARPLAPASWPAGAPRNVWGMQPAAPGSSPERHSQAELPGRLANARGARTGRRGPVLGPRVGAQAAAVERRGREVSDRGVHAVLARAQAAVSASAVCPT